MQAPVEIRYEGAVLARGVAPTGSIDDGGIMFVPLADPMPVGTRLELCSGNEIMLVRVVRVSESPDVAVAGISVRPAGVAETVEVIPLEPEPVVAAALSGPAPVVSATARTEPVPAPTPVAAQAVAPAPVAALPATPSAPVATTGNGARTASGVVQAIIAPEASEPLDATEGEDTGSLDTGSTSEYPALTNGAGTKRRRKTRNKR